MRYLMLMWADADAASGDESDFQAWADFDEQVKGSGAFVLNAVLNFQLIPIFGLTGAACVPRRNRLP